MSIRYLLTEILTKNLKTQHVNFGHVAAGCGNQTICDIKLFLTAVNMVKELHQSVEY